MLLFVGRSRSRLDRLFHVKQSGGGGAVRCVWGLDGSRRGGYGYRVVCGVRTVGGWVVWVGACGCRLGGLTRGGDRYGVVCAVRAFGGWMVRVGVGMDIGWFDAGWG